MSPLAGLWPAILRRSRRALVDVQLSKVNQQVVEEFAYHQADLLRDQLITREDALAAIAERFPELTSGQVAQALARCLFLSR